MPVLQFKGKTAVECYHHSVPHHALEFDAKLSLLGKGETPGLDGNLKIWIHRDDLARFEQDTGCKVRPMLVPFNLK